MSVRGRSLVALGLVGFVLVATGVIWRRSFGTARAREQNKLEDQRSALEAARAKLEGDIRDASSRASLARVVEERLHMSIPNDSLVTYVPRAAAKPQGKRGSR